MNPDFQRNEPAAWHMETDRSMELRVALAEVGDVDDTFAAVLRRAYDTNA